MNESLPLKPKRRWYRCSLRTLLFGLLLLSGCGPSKEQQAVDGDQALHATDPEKRQRAAIAAIEKLGGDVGVDDADAVRTIDLCNTQIIDAGLEHLEELTDLKWLDLSGTQLTDAGLSHLKGLNNLQELWLSTTQISNAGLTHLKSLTKPKLLEVRRTQVSEDRAMNLRSTLPDCILLY